jgi:hypothetical protein
MSDLVERRQGQDRRQGPIRSGSDRRDPNRPPSPESTRSGIERRKGDRRSGLDRRRPPA